MLDLVAHTHISMNFITLHVVSQLQSEVVAFRTVSNSNGHFPFNYTAS